MRFSERIRAKAPRETIQVNSMDDNLSTSLWNLLLQWFQARGVRDSLWGEATVAIACDFIKQPVDELPGNSQSQLHGWVREIFFKFEWFEVYDLIEFIVDHVPWDGRGNSYAEP